MKEIPFFDQILTFKAVDSTFTRAKQLVINKEVHGNFLLIADRQLRGKGRKANNWFSPQGGLWFTAGFYNLPIRSSLTIYLAVSAVQAINELYQKTTGKLFIKWPNDIILNDKKLGGILTSAYPDLKYILSGTGLNTNNTGFPPELEAKAVSLSSITGCKIDNEALLQKIFRFFSDGLPDYLDNELQNIKPLYDDKYSFLKNKTIVLQTEFEQFQGLVRGINNKGALVLQLANGSIQPLYSGTVKEIID